jgi:hypothetical protein
MSYPSHNTAMGCLLHLLPLHSINGSQQDSSCNQDLREMRAKLCACALIPVSRIWIWTCSHVRQVAPGAFQTESCRRSFRNEAGSIMAILNFLREHQWKNIWICAVGISSHPVYMLFLCRTSAKWLQCISFVWRWLQSRISMKTTVW